MKIDIFNHVLIPVAAFLFFLVYYKFTFKEKVSLRNFVVSAVLSILLVNIIVLIT